MEVTRCRTSFVMNSVDPGVFLADAGKQPFSPLYLKTRWDATGPMSCVIGFMADNIKSDSAGARSYGYNPQALRITTAAQKRGICGPDSMLTELVRKAGSNAVHKPGDPGIRRRQRLKPVPPRQTAHALTPSKSRTMPRASVRQPAGATTSHAV